MNADTIMNFTDLLRTAQRTQGSLLCVGLDPDPARFPDEVRRAPDPIVEFNRRIIDATSDLVCAYKINLAFYEGAGERGWQIVHRTLEAIPKGIVTIGDAKRGDIGNSSALYARALMEDFRFDACTVNPYMGTDSVLPFLTDPARGVFILAVTSNPGARDFQYLKVRGKPLYEHVIARARKWNARKNCGLVVGATRPAELKRVRAQVPDMPILLPGIGTQGGDLRAAVRHGCDRHGELAVINASRSVLYASAGGNFADAARTEALALRDAINRHRPSAGKG
jgi:orotidine-5'-phosphate decarboxylase